MCSKEYKVFKINTVCQTFFFFPKITAKTMLLEIAFSEYPILGSCVYVYNILHTRVLVNGSGIREP